MYKQKYRNVTNDCKKKEKERNKLLKKIKDSKKTIIKGRKDLMNTNLTEERRKELRKKIMQAEENLETNIEIIQEKEEELFNNCLACRILEGGYWNTGFKYIHWPYFNACNIKEFKQMDGIIYDDEGKKIKGDYIKLTSVNLTGKLIISGEAKMKGEVGKFQLKMINAQHFKLKVFKTTVNYIIYDCYRKYIVESIDNKIYG